MLIIIKIITSAIAITAITEIAKKYTIVGGLIAAMPINTLLSLAWLYFEKRDVSLLSNFTQAVFIGIFPTLIFLISTLYLFKKQWNFLPTMAVGLCIFTMCCYFSYKISIQL